ncbi:MAG: NAD(P)-dependent oxidoreductase [Candidatus Velamenicoccus archaeovorus]
MTDGRFLVISPPEDGWQVVHGSRRYLHGGRRYRDIAERTFAGHGEVHHVDWRPEATPEARAALLDAALPQAHAVVVAPWLGLGDPELPPFDAARLGRADALRVVAGTFDYRLRWIDLDEAGRRDVAVVDTSRTMTPTVAEFGVGITLALLRDIPAAIDVVRSGGWPEAPKDAGAYVFRDLADCRVGLAGYGTINRHYRGFIAPYGCEVRIYDPFVARDVVETDAVTPTGSLAELARWSDVFVVSIPPTPATLGVVDANVIDALPSGSLFVLLSRMAVVEQDALWRRVRAGELRAAVDVYDPEPPPADAWFRRDPNVLPTPHIAGNVGFAHERCFREACLDALRVVNGEPPRHAVTLRDKRLYEGTLATG